MKLSPNQKLNNLLKRIEKRKIHLADYNERINDEVYNDFYKRADKLTMEILPNTCISNSIMV